MSPQQQGSLIIDWDLDMDPPSREAGPYPPCACSDAQVLAKDDLEAALRQSVLHTLQLQSLLLERGSRPADTPQRLRPASSTRPVHMQALAGRRSAARRPGTAPRPQAAHHADVDQPTWKGASWGPGWDSTGPLEQTPRQQLRPSGQHVRNCRPQQRSRSEQGRRAMLHRIDPSSRDQFHALTCALERLAASQEADRAAHQGLMASLATDLEVGVVQFDMFCHVCFTLTSAKNVPRMSA